MVPEVGQEGPQEGLVGAHRSVDQLKAFTSLRLDTFEGTLGSDVEAWFR